MTTRKIGFVALLCAIASPAFAAPTVSAVPGGIQGGNWKWTFDITPDLSLVPDGSGTPIAVEFGFRLTGAQLLSATIADSLVFDTANPGKKVFGWESTVGCNANGNPCGLQLNPATGEIFAAFGSSNITVPGPKHFLTITAAGPPSSTSSTLQWLGAYSNNGRIAQITGGTPGGPYAVGNFDIFSGSATQFVPEPCSALLLGSIFFALPLGRYRRAT